MKKVFLLGLLIILLLITVVIITAFSRNPKSYDAEVSIGEHAFKAEIANDLLSRAKGLSERDSLDAGTGMLFIFEFPEIQSFWMKGMKFPIDIIWIRDNKVIGISQNIPIPSGSETPSFKSPEEANFVFEVNAGTAERLGLKAGDNFSYGILKER